ncbi:unnamed protein product [Pylaiella littoralis]
MTTTCRVRSGRDASRSERTRSSLPGGRNFRRKVLPLFDTRGIPRAPSRASRLLPEVGGAVEGEEMVRLTEERMQEAVRVSQ